MSNEIKFHVDENAMTIYVMKVIPSPVEKTWEYFTNKELIDLWWAPQPWQSKTSSLDLKPNGLWHYAMVNPNGEKQLCGVQYQEIRFHRSIDWVDFFENEKSEKDLELPVSNWLIGFTGVQNGTKLTININLKSKADLKKLLEMGFEDGFKATLHQLEEIIQ